MEWRFSGVETKSHGEESSNSKAFEFYTNRFVQKEASKLQKKKKFIAYTLI